MDRLECTVKLGTLVRPYLKDGLNEIVQIELPELVMHSIAPPVRRKIYDSVIKCTDVVGFFAHLDERQAKRNVRRIAAPQVVQFSETMSTPMIRLFKRLESEGMSAAMEDQLMLMKDHMIKISRQMNIASSQRSRGHASLSSSASMGNVDLSKLMGQMDLEVHSVSLAAERKNLATNAAFNMQGTYV